MNILKLNDNQINQLTMLFEGAKKKKKLRNKPRRKGHQIYPFPLPYVVSNPGETAGDYISGADSYMV
jgi:hypothetical protein